MCHDARLMVVIDHAMDVTALNALGGEQKEGITMAEDPDTQRRLERLEGAVHELRDQWVNFGHDQAASWTNFGLDRAEQAVTAATNRAKTKSRHLDDLVAEREAKGEQG